MARTCPFCAAGSLPTRWMSAAGAVVTPIVLSACYGAPPCDEADIVDADADGFSTCSTFGYISGEEDCDDTAATTFPGATEVCDDAVDNDCDFNTDADDSDCVAEDTDSPADSDSPADTQ
jgi:hypothetical protein